MCPSLSVTCKVAKCYKIKTSLHYCRVARLLNSMRLQGRVLLLTGITPARLLNAAWLLMLQNTRSHKYVVSAQIVSLILVEMDTISQSQHLYLCHIYECPIAYRINHIYCCFVLPIWMFLFYSLLE